MDCSAKKLPTNQIVTLNTKAPVPAFSVTEAGDTNTLVPFNLTRTGDVVRAEAPLGNGLEIVKEYRLSTNYLLKASIRYENRGTQAVALPERELVIGTATPMGHRNESIYLGMEWFNGDSSTRSLNRGSQINRWVAPFPGTPKTEYRAGASNVVWAAVQNQFFTMIAVPETPASEVVAHRILLPPPTRAEMVADPSAFATPFGYQTALVLAPNTIAPSQSVEYRFDLFAGPKEFKTLQQLPRDMDRVMGFSGFFGFFAKALLLSMNGLHAIGSPTGWAIIVITVIIKLLFWPLTAASTRSMKRMQALQPQMKAIQEKYKDDPRKMNQKTMEFMKENKVSPLGGCLPMLLQIPVFFGFYRMIQSAIELRGATFPLGLRPFAAGHVVYASRAEFPVQSAAAVHGRDDALAGAADAAFTGHGPGAAEDHALHAADVHGHSLQFLGRIDALLDGAKSANHSQMKITRAILRNLRRRAGERQPWAARARQKKKITDLWQHNPKAILEKLLKTLGFEGNVDRASMDGQVFLTSKRRIPGRLIGRQGQTLSELQYSLNRLIFKLDPEPEGHSRRGELSLPKARRPRQKSQGSGRKSPALGRHRRIGTAQCFRPPHRSQRAQR